MECMRASEGAPATGWRSLWRSHRKGLAALALTLGLVVAADVVLAATIARYRDETTRLRLAMSEGERERADLILATERHRVMVEIELLRLRARGDRDLHLAVEVDSGRMILEREGVLLRDMRVRITPQQVKGIPGGGEMEVLPRGARTVERILTARDVWEIPASVYARRGVPTPPERAHPGVVGRTAALLGDGMVIYAAPDTGLLADSAAALPGSIRVTKADLRALAPNLVRGMAVYFY